MDSLPSAVCTSFLWPLEGRSEVQLCVVIQGGGIGKPTHGQLDASFEAADMGLHAVLDVFSGQLVCTCLQ